MYNIRYVEEHIEKLKEISEKKGLSLDFQEFARLNEERKTLKGEVDELRRQKNEKGQKVGELKREGKDASHLIPELERLKEEITTKEKTLKQIQKKVTDFISWIPNRIHHSIKDEPVIIKESTKIKDFPFKPLTHIELGKSLGILDFECASHIAGSNFALYKGKGATLERALINFMLDLHMKRHGYTEIFPPFLVNEEAMFSTGQLPKMKDDMYITERDGLFLNPTAEVPLTNILANKILSTNSLPIKYCAYTACFRREAGSYGKETKGLLRIHQFNKVELVNFVHPEESYKTLEILLTEAESVLKLLSLPYRVVQLPLNDLSFASAKTYDIEVYAAGVDRWLEVSSVSNFEDFQAKRAQIRIKSEGETKHIHTLNASGVATPRLLIALIENLQTEKGEVEIPEPLIPYTGFEKID